MENENKYEYIYSEEVINNKFIVKGSGGKFSWCVYGTRIQIETEPFRNSCKVKGEYPYTWIEPNNSY